MIRRAELGSFRESFPRPCRRASGRHGAAPPGPAGRQIAEGWFPGTSRTRPRTAPGGGPAPSWVVLAPPEPAATTLHPEIRRRPGGCVAERLRRLAKRAGEFPGVPLAAASRGLLGWEPSPKAACAAPRRVVAAPRA